MKQVICRRRRLHLFVLAVSILAFVRTVPAAPAQAGDLTKIIHERVETVLDGLAAGGPYEDAQLQLNDLLGSVAAYLPQTQAAGFREVAFAQRMVNGIAALPEAKRPQMLKYLRTHPLVAQTLAFLIRDGEPPAGVYELLDRLVRERGERVETYANLAAAICVVHDKPLVHKINENHATAGDPVALFDYFIANEGRLFFGLRDVPAELLVYVVDSTASVVEMQWAIDRYAGHDNVGSLFFDIKYDYDHFKSGRPKKVTQAGWNLPNILQFGGVCADQAHFAATVGKAIGVPTTYTRGRSGEVSHAWVGFLQAAGRNVRWNFDSGRYEAYQGVKGVVVDPQTREIVNDSEVSLLAGLGLTKPDARRDALAVIDAARCLNAFIGSKEPFAPTPLIEGAEQLRRPDAESVLALVEAALRMSANEVRAWAVLAELAANGQLTLQQKRHWANLLERLCGDQYPDFFLSVLSPMIAAVEDPRDQDRFWEAAYRFVQRRADLAAEVRFAQGRLWEKHGDLNRAGRYYEDVIKRSADAGPFVVDALARCDAVLVKLGRERAIPSLYVSAFEQTSRPKSTAESFYRQSNWFRIGTLAVKRLNMLGMGREAAEIQRDIERIDAGR